MVAETKYVLVEDDRVLDIIGSVLQFVSSGHSPMRPPVEPDRWETMSSCLYQ